MRMEEITKRRPSDGASGIAPSKEGRLTNE
jgi:hypothetical protein